MDQSTENFLYAIPANYTDSGKLFNGMIDPRNAAETLLLLITIGVPEFLWLPVPGTVLTVIMTVTLLPLGVVAAMGIDGGSLFQYLAHIIRFFMRRRKLHYRRIQIYNETEIKSRKSISKRQEAKKMRKHSGLSSDSKASKRNYRDKGQSIS